MVLSFAFLFFLQAFLDCGSKSSSFSTRSPNCSPGDTSVFLLSLTDGG